jgi:small subunit ribosomal protein S1
VTDPTEDFAALFEASLKPQRLERGQTITGRIVGIGQDVAFVDVGGKGEATIDLAELRDADGALEVAVGDDIQATVMTTAGGLTLSRKLVRGAANARQLESAYQSGLAVDGKVEAEVKGGYDVRLGGTRAFCPYSQMDVRRTEPAAHIGRVYAFRIIEFKDGGRSIVVSRRAMLEAEQRAQEADVRKSIVVGAVLTGHVASVREFGAFVDLGAGVQGLLHVSEMGWSRVTDPAQIVKPGEAITVRVLRVENDGQKIALGLKQLTADPWSNVLERFAVGEVYSGRVTRHADFGAFIELAPGVEALAHVSTFHPSGRSQEWASQIPVGTSASFEILTIDPDKKRIGVAMVPEGSSRARQTSSEQLEVPPESESTPAAAPAEGFGSLADKLRGALTPRTK